MKKINTGDINTILGKLPSRIVNWGGLFTVCFLGILILVSTKIIYPDNIIIRSVIIYTSKTDQYLIKLPAIYSKQIKLGQKCQVKLDYPYMSNLQGTVTNLYDKTSSNLIEFDVTVSLQLPVKPHQLLLQNDLSTGEVILHIGDSSLFEKIFNNIRTVL